MTSCDAELSEALLPDGFCARELPVDVNEARSLVALGTTDLLVLERGRSRVALLRDEDGDVLTKTTIVRVRDDSLTHGLAIHDGYLYASSPSTVFRWPYQPGETSVGGDRERVIVNMNADGMGGAPWGHKSRTLIFDELGKLYVSIGSKGNVAPDSFRARIRRFDLTDGLPIEFVDGEVFADGLRNTVGLGFDRHGVLWGVVNGADRLMRDDLGGDIHENNPCEELNRFPEELAGQHWGYPYCWAEYELAAGLGRGTRWAWPSFLGESLNSTTTITDEFCRTDIVPTDLAMQAHSAPLGIVFYNYTEDVPAGCSGTFPEEMDGFAFVAHHGSWNRDVPTGYKVVYIPMTEEGRVPAGEETHDLLWHDGGAKWDDGFRPVDVDFDECGRLVVTSDGTSDVGGSKMVRITYQNAAAMPSATPTLGTSPSVPPDASPSVPSDATPSPTPGAATPSSSPVPSAGPPVTSSASAFGTSVEGLVLLVIATILRLRQA